MKDIEELLIYGLAVKWYLERVERIIIVEVA